MCGIWCLIKLKQINLYDYQRDFKCIQSRGPDRSYLIDYNDPYNIIIGFHRLSIMDPSFKADQPFIHEYNDSNSQHHTILTICNGEIYNYKELANEYDILLHSGSDCEVLYPLYLKIGFDTLVRKINGEFAFIIIDITMKTGDMSVYIARDPFGIRPLFVSETQCYINFSSEIKGIFSNKTKGISAFKPGHYMTLGKNNGLWNSLSYTQYYSCHISPSIYPKDNDSLQLIKNSIREKLSEAVKCRLISDRPIGFLLSGGLDSSLVVSIASRLLKGQQLRTFSIGMHGSTDEKYAKLVAQYIGSNHTHITCNQGEFINALPEVIRITETYDITTIRASTGQYLISKWIANNTNIKVLLIGDGSDELCSGYLYFHKAPDALVSHKENIRLLENISYFDILRADRCISNNGLESRVPYLDQRFVNYYLSIDPSLRVPNNNIEKWLLRESFNTDYLPHEVLWRKKEAFSDAVSSQEKSWFNIIQEYIENKYTLKDLEYAKEKYTHNIPISKESLYFRNIFNEYYGKDLDHIIPYYWLPKWCGDTSEPSARILNL